MDALADVMPQFATDGLQQPVPVGEVEAAIDPRLTEGDLEELQSALDNDLQASLGAKVDIDERVRRYRKYFALDRDPPAYKNAPNHRVPYIRGKVLGAAAQHRSALDQDPFFTTRPYTREAQENQGPWETMMERELDRSNSRRQIWNAIQESCLVGTGMIQLSVTQPYDEIMVQMKAIRLEDFHVAPVEAEAISRLSTFYRFVEPFHILRARFESGEYDPDKMEAIKSAQAIREEHYDAQQDGSRVYTYQTENAPRELWECYYRWGNDNVDYTLWRVIYSQQTAEILRVEESPYLEAFDAPPYFPVRPMPRIDYFYGESYSQVLEGIQNILDYSYNSKLAYDQFAIAPPTFIDVDSEFYPILKEKGWTPGMMIPVRGDPKQSVYQLPLQKATEPTELMGLASALGDDATYSDLMLQGLPTNKVRSATEISAMMSQGTRKLAMDLSNIANDLSQGARMYWALIYLYKIKGKGVMPVFKGSDQFLIAAEEISQDELLTHMVEFFASRVGMPIPPEVMPQMKQVIEMQLQAQGVELFVSSAQRDDLEWICNGEKLVPDKQMRANKLERLIASLLPAIQIARVDAAAWNMMKEYLESLDFHNWRDLLPPEPPSGQADEQQMQMFAQNMNQLRPGGGSGS